MGTDLWCGVRWGWDLCRNDGATRCGGEGRRWWELQPDGAPASWGEGYLNPAPLPQQIRGLQGWGLLVVFGEAECYLEAAGVSAGWDETLRPCRWCSAIPACPLPSPRVGCGFSEPWLLGIIPLGMRRCGGCGCPCGEGTGLCWGLVCVGVELRICGSKGRRDLPCSQAALGFGALSALPTSTQVGQWLVRGL